MAEPSGHPAHSGLLTHDGLDLKNHAAQRDDPPRCANCERMERRIKELEGQLEEMKAHNPIGSVFEHLEDLYE